MRIHFLATFSVCFHLEILLPWQRDLMTSPLYTIKTAGDFWQITTQLKISARQYWPEFSLIDYYGYNHRFFAIKTAIGNVIIAVFNRNNT